MVTGIKMPFQVNSYGGVALTDKDANDAKIIKIALSDGDNENAFQQNITLGKEVIFETSSGALRSRITTKLKRMFKSFEAEKRFKLMVSTIVWETVEDTGEDNLEFKYLDLESDEEKTYQQNF